MLCTGFFLLLLHAAALILESSFLWLKCPQPRPGLHGRRARDWWLRRFWHPRGLDAAVARLPRLGAAYLHLRSQSRGGHQLSALLVRSGLLGAFCGRPHTVVFGDRGVLGLHQPRRVRCPRPDAFAGVQALRAGQGRRGLRRA